MTAALALLMRYLPHLAVAAVLTGAAWWYGEGRFDSGHRDGYTDGRKQGADEARTAAEQHLKTVLAEAQAEKSNLIEKARRHDQTNQREYAARREADLLAAADRDRDLADRDRRMRSALAAAAARARAGNAHPVSDPARDSKGAADGASAGSGLVLSSCRPDVAADIVTAGATSAAAVRRWRDWAATYEGWRAAPR